MDINTILGDVMKYVREERPVMCDMEDSGQEMSVPDAKAALSWSHFK